MTRGRKTCSVVHRGDSGCDKKATIMAIVTAAIVAIVTAMIKAPTLATVAASHTLVTQ